MRRHERAGQTRAPVASLVHAAAAARSSSFRRLALAREKSPRTLLFGAGVHRDGGLALSRGFMQIARRCDEYRLSLTKRSGLVGRERERGGRSEACELATSRRKTAIRRRVAFLYSLRSDRELYSPCARLIYVRCIKRVHKSKRSAPVGRNIPRVGSSKSDACASFILRAPRDIVFRIGHSETLYHRPGVETGPPEGKNFTADFSIRDAKKPGEICRKFPGKKL